MTKQSWAGKVLPAAAPPASWPLAMTALVKRSWIRRNARLPKDDVFFELKMEKYQSLAELHGECFPGKPWGAAEFSDLQKGGAEIIASENSFIVWRVAADEAEIITVGVRPSMRRAGVASALIGLMERDLPRHGVSKIFLEVAADNAAARKLYEKCGFAHVGLRPKYYDGIDAMIMAKNIDTGCGL